MTGHAHCKLHLTNCILQTAPYKLHLANCTYCTLQIARCTILQIAPRCKLHHVKNCTTLIIAPHYKLHHVANRTTLKIALHCKLHHVANCNTLQIVPRCKLHHVANCTTGNNANSAPNWVGVGAWAELGNIKQTSLGQERCQFFFFILAKGPMMEHRLVN